MIKTVLPQPIFMLPCKTNFTTLLLVKRAQKSSTITSQIRLTTWKHSPDGRILKSDTQVAKNYLSQKQISTLERNVSGYFDYIGDLIKRRNTFTMQEFADSIDRFLEFREYKILPNNGSISMKDAKEKASKEYVQFNKTQVINSDFDKQIKQLKQSQKNN